jgi:hypothetical protein
MDYVFGTYKDKETVKTKSSEHTELSGWQVNKMTYHDCSIEDKFYVVEKYRSDEDVEGNCYDWYEIDHHYRIVDKSCGLQAQIEAITPYKATKTAYIGDTEITFYDVPEGNVTVFFDKPYTMEKVAGGITLTFEELEEVTDITISIL